MSDYKTRAKQVKDNFSKPVSEKVSELWNRLTAKEETEEEKKKRKRKEQAARAVKQYGTPDEE